jgi:hypothetical protein
MKMKKIFFLYLILLSFCFFGCNSLYKAYEITPFLQYPEWILTEYPNYIGEKDKEKYEYNQNNFFIQDSQVMGNKFSSLYLFINPNIKFKNLNIIEISYIKDDDIMILINDKVIKYTGRQQTLLMDIKFRDYPKYYKNMEINDKAIIKITQKYQFDNGPIITEDALYILSCFEYEHIPFSGLIP